MDFFFLFFFFSHQITGFLVGFDFYFYFIFSFSYGDLGD